MSYVLCPMSYTYLYAAAGHLRDGGAPYSTCYTPVCLSGALCAGFASRCLAMQPISYPFLAGYPSRACSPNDIFVAGGAAGLAAQMLSAAGAGYGDGAMHYALLCVSVYAYI